MWLRFVFLIFTSRWSVDVVLAGSLTVTDPTIVVAGQDAKLVWTLIKDQTDPQGADILNIRCGAGQSTYTSTLARLLASGDASKFESTTTAAETFSRRLTASMTSGIYVITITNVTYTDARSYGCSYLYTDDASRGTWATTNVTLIVQGGPSNCGRDLDSEFLIPESSVLTLNIELCGNPRPSVQWSTSVSGVPPRADVGRNISVAKFEYEYTGFPAVNREMCGKLITYEASNIRSTLRKDARLKVLFNPGTVTIRNANAYQDDASNRTYITSIRWDAIKAGDCNVKYDVEYMNQGNPVFVQASDSSSISNVYVSPRPTHVRIRANVTQSGDFTEPFVITFGPSPTGAPFSTRSLLTAPVAGKSNTPAVIGGVVAAIIVLIIIIVVVVILCRRKNAGNDRSRGDHKPLHQMRTIEDGPKKPESHYAQADDVLPKKNGANQPGLLYAELGPGGRVGPRDQPLQSHYAEVKQDDKGFPAIGNPNEPAPKSLPRGQTAPLAQRANTDSDAAREPRYFAKDRDSDPDYESDDDHEGVIV